MRSRVSDILFLLLRVAIHGCKEDFEVAAQVDWNSVDWAEVYALAKGQGVAAIAFDGALALHKRCPEAISAIPRQLKMRWVSISDNIEKGYNRQLVRSAELASLYGAEGVATYVLKGIAVSTYFPIPAHRECGDLDCFLGKDYERGNVIAEQNGADVSRGFYKHSHIDFRGLTVENHQFCTAIRGSRDRKAFERHLQGLLTNRPVEYISNTSLIKPSADFNALFLTAHGLEHFLSEGIKLRHILDWALLLKAEQNNIDWAEFYRWTDRMHMTRFADALSAISVEHLGLPITNSAIHQSASYAGLVLRDTLYHSVGIFNKGYSAWMGRLMLIKNKLSFGWKYHKVYQKSVVVELTRTILAFLFEKKPKI